MTGPASSTKIVTREGGIITVDRYADGRTVVLIASYASRISVELDEDHLNALCLACLPAEMTLALNPNAEHTQHERE